MKTKLNLLLTLFLVAFAGLDKLKAQSAEQLLEDRETRNEVMERIANDPDMMHTMMQHMMRNQQAMQRMMEENQDMRVNMMRQMMRMAEADSSMRVQMRDRMKDHPKMMQMMHDMPREDHMMNDEGHHEGVKHHNRRKDKNRKD